MALFYACQQTYQMHIIKKDSKQLILQKNKKCIRKNMCLQAYSLKQSFVEKRVERKTKIIFPKAKGPNQRSTNEP